MSFSVTNNKIKYEWAGKNLKTIFDYKNLFTIRYLKVLKDIFKFSRLCEKDVSFYNISLKKFLKKYNFSEEFIDLYVGLTDIPLKKLVEGCLSNSSDVVTKIDCEENKLVVFNTQLKHRIVSQTDKTKRVVINFNYF